MKKRDGFMPIPSVTVIGPKLPFEAKEVRYAPSDDGAFGIIAFTEGGVFQLNRSLNRWDPLIAGTRSSVRAG